MIGPTGGWKKVGAARLAFIAMILGVVAVYFPTGYQPGSSSLVGLDHQAIHMRRIAFAQDALMGEAPSLPGWYPRELLGTPFWANIQNFPFIPTRLVVLLVSEPRDALMYGSILAALLSATFTFFFCRRLDLSPVASAAAGWTFACAGFFASRVLAGHLPLLEAYPALPLLLLLAEASIQRKDEPRAFAFSLLWLGLASACTALAGHPQLPIYSLATAMLYLVARDRTRAGLTAMAVMVLGALLAAFSLWPMALLSSQSTRLLALDPPTNDLPLPYARLVSFFAPWRDGWPQSVLRDPPQPFAGYPSPAFFWDTVCYVGLLPWLGLFALVVHRIYTRRLLDPRIRFVLVAGVFALLFALPVWHELMSRIPGTLLRSPVRLLYITGFSLAIILAVSLDRLSGVLSHRGKGFACATLALLLAVHGFDLAAHDRAFIVVRPTGESLGDEVATKVIKSIGEGRVAFDVALDSKLNRRLDDIGFFDSIMLAHTYQGLLHLTGAPATRNVQRIDGSNLSRRTLAACAVRTVVTNRARPDLTLLSEAGNVRVYSVPGSAERAQFYRESDTETLPPDQIAARLRDPQFDLNSKLLLSSVSTPRREPTSETPDVRGRVTYRRTSSDRIEITVDSPSQAGLVRVAEAWHPGWHAELNGAPAPTVMGNGMFLCVPVPAGSHRLTLEFRTPGHGTGLAISVLAGLGMLTLVGRTARSPLSTPATA